MVEERYYTPEAEEFHIGFEYEIVEFKSLNGAATQLQYVKTTIENNSEWLMIDERRKIKQVRVKYLDKEDIESLFELRQLPDYFEFEFDLLYDKEPVGNVSIYEDGIIDDLMFFNTSFKIKNKSELEKLMQQLSIK